ncbi:luciferin 4-monooxygenase-like [Drosophila elegans]|uniref:luciferin 4-monooxygenase-like n=1 Tax=Drosophila elegans TaxID=30023 RepID=UPI0007E621B2|nr:luciferin 4-monooxygenase-like [Drosophila elegans]XP_017129625.1 luciferin 4-monooxygenase-like [Drosophila elegans]
MGELNAGITPLETECTYDDNLKIWSGGERQSLFSADLSIGEIIFQEMERHPKLIAQISVTDDVVLTREELFLNAKRVASYMRNLGLGQNDIVGVMGRHTTHLAAVAYACYFNGTPFHALHNAYEQSTIAKLFGITKPRLIFCDGDEFDKVRAASQGHQVQIVTMRNHPRCDSIRIQDVLTTPVDPNFRPVRLTLGTDQTLAILSSSGTTGVPKAVTISNSHQIIVAFLNMNNSIVQYTSSTLDWFSGLVMNITAGVFSTTNIIADGDFDPALLCNIIRQYKISLVLLSSSYMAMLANCPEFKTADLSSLKNLFYGGSNCSLDVQKRARSRLSHDCLNFSYSLTELNSAGCINFNFDQKPNSVGRPVRGIKVKVIDSEGKAQGPNTVGEICFYSGQKWYGYYESPEETRLILDSQNWFHTGDLGYVDEDGYVFIIDRIKDMLKYQNIMYYPSEIENVIAEMPDVVEACVFGIWDEVNGDEAAASVVRKQGSELNSQDVVDYVRKRISAKYKQLNGGALIVDQITGVGDRKTNRAAAKAHFLKHMNNN